MRVSDLIKPFGACTVEEQEARAASARAARFGPPVVRKKHVAKKPSVRGKPKGKADAAGRGPVNGGDAPF